MSNHDPVTVTTTEAELNVVRALAERETAQQQQRVADIKAINEAGYKELGIERHDANCQALANLYGGNIPAETLDALRGAQMPQRTIAAIAEDPAYAERWKTMSPAAQRAEILARETQTGYGRAFVAHEPAYKNPAFKGGPVSDADLPSIPRR